MNSNDGIAKMYGKQDKFGIDQGEMTDSNAAAALSEYSDDYVGNAKPEHEFRKDSEHHNMVGNRVMMSSNVHNHMMGGRAMMFNKKQKQGRFIISFASIM